MKNLKANIILLILITGILSFGGGINGGLLYAHELVESEIEETNSEIGELTSVNELDQAENGGDSGEVPPVIFAPTPSSHFLSSPSHCYQWLQRNNTALFILYCSLKLDC